MFAITGKGYAYVFSAVAPSGQTLYYNYAFNEEQAVCVTAPSWNDWDGYTAPQGLLVIPPTVEYNGVVYTVVEIDRWAFHLCTGLTSVVIPNTVKYLYSQCFHNCTNLSSVSIGSSVELIDMGCFGNTAWYNYQPDGVVYLDGWCMGIKGDYTFEDGILEIQEGTRGIACYSFPDRDDLYTVIIPNSVEVICSQAFYQNESLSSVIMGDSVKKIQNYAFYLCSGLSSITLPGTLEYIGDMAFADCEALNAVYFTGDIAQWCNITFDDNPLINAHNLYINGELLENLVIPETVTEIKGNVFAEASCLTSLTIPNSVTSIEPMAFSGCSGLETIVVESGNPTYDSRNNSNAIIETATNTLHTGCKNTVIPNSVTTIGFGSFMGQTGLTFLKIPTSVTNIESEAFWACDHLNTITVLSINPPTLYSSLPSENPGFTIYVPNGSLEAYKQANVWRDYKDYMQPISTVNLYGYGQSYGNWCFISSPLVGNTSPLVVEELLDLENAYHDLYRFDQSFAGQEWQNYKASAFPLVNGQGYLYANKKDVDLIFKGTFNEDEAKTVSLTYVTGKPFAGWNLVGNPFPVNAYANRSYYVMNAAGTGLDPVPVSSSIAIPPCTGLMVKANAAGETVTFTKSSSKNQDSDQGMLTITVSQDRDNTVTHLDKAIVSFNEGDKLEKTNLRSGQTSLSIASGTEEYAIYTMRQKGEIQLHFTVENDGSYTLHFDVNTLALDDLHLIDTVTGEDIDLLQQPNYRFFAKTTDDKERFRLTCK